MRIILDTVKMKQDSGGIRQVARNNTEEHVPTFKYALNVMRNMWLVYSIGKLLNIVHVYAGKGHGQGNTQTTIIEKRHLIGMEDGANLLGDILMFGVLTTRVEQTLRNPMSWNIVSLWKRYLGDIYYPLSRFTTRMGLGMITELRILNSGLSNNRQGRGLMNRNIVQHALVLNANSGVFTLA